VVYLFTIEVGYKTTATIAWMSRTFRRPINERQRSQESSKAKEAPEIGSLLCFAIIVCPLPTGYLVVNRGKWLKASSRAFAERFHSPHRLLPLATVSHCPSMVHPGFGPQAISSRRRLQGEAARKRLAPFGACSGSRCLSLSSGVVRSSFSVSSAEQGRPKRKPCTSTQPRSCR
jgi:hypothetical protein